MSEPVGRANHRCGASARSGEAVIGAPHEPVSIEVLGLAKARRARAKAEAGDLLFGTIDTWLIWHLTGGVDGGVHVTDATNASRTMLMGLDSLAWEADLLDAVGVPVLSQSEDIANARLHFEDGCVANVTASRISPERMRKIRIFQEDAYISLDYQNQSGEIYRRVGKQIWRDRAEIEHGEPLKLQLTSFIECASTGRQPRVSGSQATAALELAVKITKQISSSG